MGFIRSFGLGINQRVQQGAGLKPFDFNTDIEYTNGNFVYADDSLSDLRSGFDNIHVLVLKENITKVEFKVSSLYDSGFFSLVFGKGLEGESISVAGSYLTGVGRTENPYLFNWLSASEQPNSLCGEGRFSPPYTNPQNIPELVSVNDVCTIDIKYDCIIGTINRNGTILNWFFLWKNGEWTNPSRYGWSDGLRIGFAVRFAAGNLNILQNLKVLRRGAVDITGNKWLAIGDSITGINNNNDLSYPGFVRRNLNLNLINKGYGGYTIYRLWKDRNTTWASELNSLGSNDIISIEAGTNDFDTYNFPAVATESEMDNTVNPHPWFGTMDSEDPTYKNSHYSLGCLRLMIEYIQVNAPLTKLIVFTPIYREGYGSITGGVFDKMLINADGRTIYDYADAIKLVCAEYGVTCLDLCYESGIDSETLPTYTYDLLHLNQNGGKLIGDQVGAEFAKHI